MGRKQVSFLLITVSDDKNMPGLSSDKQSKISWSSLELGITLCKSLYVLTVCDPGRVVLTTHSLTNCRYGCNRTNLMLYLSRFKFVSPPKLKKSFSNKNLDFQAQHLNYHIALEPRILNLEGSSFGKRLSVKIMFVIGKIFAAR